MQQQPQQSSDGIDRHKRRWLRRGVQAALIIALILGLRAWQRRDLVADAAPDIDGVLLDGRPFALSGLRGQPVLVHFWASWCPICRLEQNGVDALARDYRVIAVAMQSGSDAEVQTYLRDHELSFPVLNDPDGHIAAKWGIRGVPTSFVLDTAGHIRFTEVGYTTAIGLRARMWLAGR